MRRLTLALFSLLLLVPLYSQDSLNISQAGRWHDPSLPSTSGIRYNDVWGYTDTGGREYGIAGSARYTLFFELDSPEGLREAARFDEGFSSIWRDYKTYGHYAYGTADQGNGGLIVYDLSGLPGSVTKVYQSNAVFSRAHNLFVDEAQGRLYVAGSNTRPNGVIIFDLNADPASPTLLADPVLPEGGYIHDIFVRNHIAYCSHGFLGLAVYDLSQPASPIPLGTMTNYPEQGYNHSSWLTEDSQLLIFADETFGRSLKAVDVSNLQDMEVTSLFKSELLAPAHTNSIAHNPFIRGRYAVVSYYHDGVQVFDLSDPEHIQQVAWYDTYPEHANYQGFRGCWGVYPFLPSGRILATDISNGFFVLQPQGWSFDEPAPSAELSMSGEIQLCPGDSVLLSATFSGEGWLWERDGQVFSANPYPIWASQAGAYRLANYSAGGAAIYSGTVSVAIDTAPVEELPQPWQEAIIGNAPSTQAAFFPCSSGEDFFLATKALNPGSGAQDHLGAALQPICGNFTITAQVVGAENGQAGLVVRESTASGSKFAGMFTSGGATYRREARLTTGGAKISALHLGSPNGWMRLQRQGQLVRMYRSFDGAQFQLLTQIALPLDECAEVGLAVFAQRPGQTASAEFHSVSIETNGQQLSASEPEKGRQSPPEGIQGTPSLSLGSPDGLDEKAGAPAIAPNPSRGAFALYFQQPLSSPAIVELLSPNGKSLHRAQIAAGAEVWHYQGPPLPSGLYLLNVGQHTLRAVVE